MWYGQMESWALLVLGISTELHLPPDFLILKFFTYVEQLWGYYTTRVFPIHRVQLILHRTFQGEKIICILSIRTLRVFLIVIIPRAIHHNNYKSMEVI